MVPSSAAGDITFHVGDRFGSFSELEKAIAAYSSTNFVQLWKRDARTINAAKKRVGNIASKMGPSGKTVGSTSISLPPKMEHTWRSELRTEKGAPRNDLEATVKLLQDKYHCTVRVLADENNDLRAIFFQDEGMKRSFSNYPEIIFIDATYKLLETRMSCFLVIVEDGNGESEIVAVGLFSTEDGDTLKWFFEVFTAVNGKWDSIKVTMADKDIKERHVVREVLPKSSLQICEFHTLRTFRRELSLQKMDISKAQQETALEILQRMVYAKNEDEYLSLYETLKESSPKQVVQYFESNWHSIYKEWTMGMKWLNGNFLNSTNNRAENINAKLKSIVDRHSSLENFVKSFFCYVRAARQERSHKAASMLQKKRVLKNSDEDHQLYCQLLTPYAYKHIERQLRLSNEANAHSNSVATANDCNCSFRVAMCLPCCHMFATRCDQGLAQV
ncbi:hypothetical protein MTO96_015917 [Rhipicephalus appendiculatus]